MKFLISGLIVISGALLLDQNLIPDWIGFTIGYGLVFFGSYKIYLKDGLKKSIIAAILGITLPTVLMINSVTSKNNSKVLEYRLNGYSQVNTKNGLLQLNLDVNQRNVKLDLINQGIFIDSINILIDDVLICDRTSKLSCTFNDEDRMVLCSTDPDFVQNESQLINSFEKIRVAFDHKQNLHDSDSAKVIFYSKSHSLKFSFKLNKQK